MGNIVSKVPLKDGTVRYLADKQAREDISDIQDILVQKVDKVAGKQLSTEDYTTIEKEKLASLEAIQVSTMPAASSAIVGKVYQYIGETDANYTNGYFYKCNSSDPDAGAYVAPDGKTYTFKYHIYIKHNTSSNLDYGTVYDFYVYSNIRMCSAPYDMNYSSTTYHIYYYDETYASNNHLKALGSWDTSNDFYQDFSNSPDQPTGGRWEYYVKSINPTQQYGWVANTYDMKVFENNEPASEVVAYLNTPIYTWDALKVQSDPAPYILPPATESTLGGIKVGNNLNIDNEGVLSAEDQIQADWNQADNTQKDYIKNKPEIRPISYIAPASASVSSIADGNNADVFNFEFYCDGNNSNLQFFSCVNFNVATTLDENTYSDCVLTITYKLDGNTVGTLEETYVDDGKKVLTINYLLNNLIAGNHIFVVNFALSGGSIS